MCQIPIYRPVVLCFYPGATHEVHRTVSKLMHANDRFGILQRGRMGCNHPLNEVQGLGNGILISNAKDDIDAPSIACYDIGNDVPQTFLLGITIIWLSVVFTVVATMLTDLTVPPTPPTST